MCHGLRLGRLGGKSIHRIGSRSSSPSPSTFLKPPPLPVALSFPTWIPHMGVLEAAPLYPRRPGLPSAFLGVF